MKTKIANDYFYQFLLEYKDFCLEKDERHYSKLFPNEVIDICVIIHWRYKKLQAKLKELKTLEQELLFMDDNSFKNILGKTVLQPVIIKKNNYDNSQPLNWFLYDRYRGEDRSLHNIITYYIYLVAVNPLLISGKNELIGLIVRIAKKALKERKKGTKLICLKVYNKETDSPIFPAEDYETKYVDNSMFDISIYKNK